MWEEVTKCRLGQLVFHEDDNGWRIIRRPKRRKNNLERNMMKKKKKTIISLFQYLLPLSRTLRRPTFLDLAVIDQLK